MKHISWKYIAGLIDGEGCFDIQIGKTTRVLVDGVSRTYTFRAPRLRIALSNNSLFLLELVQNQCGGSIYASRRAHLNSNWQDASYWQIENSRLRKILQYVTPFLILKKEQAKLLLYAIDNLQSRTVKKRGQFNHELAIQVAREELKAMKRDPQRLSEKAVERIESVLSAEATVQAA